MRKDKRLKKNSQFAQVYTKGRSWANRLLALRVLENELEVYRFGFSVSKRLGNAVVRNKVKRRLREAARLTPTVKGWDLVVIARQPAGTASYDQLKKALEDLLKRGRLLEG
ncbi:MAG: ribonuclease P protein component [Chloroflexi bacterium]|nr:ribonuclease P protein component [Chloroflexota bacterium]MBT7081369.1 ribonuclease P protein component [Chloroflexota bacterium]MBT7290677.1 ribonuclease P protein component [Chloroflexota bacterium]